MPYFNPHNVSANEIIVNFPINLMAGMYSFVGQDAATDFPVSVSAGPYSFVGQDAATDFPVNLYMV